MSKTSHFSFSIKHFQYVLIFFTLIIFLTGINIQAQSGRKAPKQTQIPAQSETQPINEIKDQQISPKMPKTLISVMSDIPQRLYLQFPFPEKMQTWVVNRLAKSMALEVSSGPFGNRPEAIKRAKSETQTFTILLQLEENVFSQPQSNSTRRAKVGNVWINYYIFAPGTAKGKQTGKVILHEYRSKKGIGTDRNGISCYPNVYGDDLLLLQASIEVADQIMTIFNLPIPPIC